MLVGALSRGYAVDVDGDVVVFDGVEDSVFADSNAVAVGGAFEFFHSVRAGVGGKVFDCIGYSLKCGGLGFRKPFELFLSVSGEVDVVCGQHNPILAKVYTLHISEYCVYCGSRLTTTRKEPPAMTTTIPLATLRSELGDTINRTHHGKDRITITRNGKPAAAIIPIEDLKYLEAVEDACDAAELNEAIAGDDGYRIPLNDVLNQINHQQ